MLDIGHGGMRPHVRPHAQMRSTLRSSGSDRALEPEGQLGQQVGDSIVSATAIKHAEVLSGKKLHQALDAWFGFPNIRNLLEAFLGSKTRKEYTNN